jgi:hypothetical protein
LLNGQAHAINSSWPHAGCNALPGGMAMLKRSFFAAAGIVMTTMFATAAMADLAPDPIPSADSGGTMVVAGVALAAIAAGVTIIMLRRKR